MFSSIFSSGLKFAGITLVVASLLAFLSAPVFFGMVIITASVVMTVYTYTVIAFILGAIFKWFKVRKGNGTIDSN
jgi:hypothetical protein